jgi:hypothetical protein
VSGVTYPLSRFRCDKSLMEGVAVSTDFSLKARENLH